MQAFVGKAGWIAALAIVSGAWMSSALAIDFVAAAPTQAKVLVDNEKVRVIHVLFRKGDVIPMHTHPDMVVHTIRGGKIRFTTAEGKVVDANPRDGEVSFRPGVTHSHEHFEDDEAIIVELKNQEP